jgi:hypothetical protein
MKAITPITNRDMHINMKNPKMRVNQLSVRPSKELKSTTTAPAVMPMSTSLYILFVISWFFFEQMLNRIDPTIAKDTKISKSPPNSQNMHIPPVLNTCYCYLS